MQAKPLISLPDYAYLATFEDGLSHPSLYLSPLSISITPLYLSHPSLSLSPLRLSPSLSHPYLLSFSLYIYISLPSLSLTDPALSPCSISLSFPQPLSPLLSAPSPSPPLSSLSLSLSLHSPFLTLALSLNDYHVTEQCGYTQVMPDPLRQSSLKSQLHRSEAAGALSLSLP